MDPKAFIATYLTGGKRHTSLYHFTDTRNLDSIRRLGLLSTRTLNAQNIKTVTGGNKWSLEADRNCGMDYYVHLCFTDEHPMEWTARKNGAILQVKYLKIDPAIMMEPGVLFTPGVANKAGMPKLRIRDGLDALDVEVLYEWTNWKDPAVRERIQQMRKCEILIPRHVPAAFIRGPI